MVFKINQVFEDKCGRRSQRAVVLWFVLRLSHFPVGCYLVAGLDLNVPSHIMPVSVGFFLELYARKNILSTACRFVVVTERDRQKVTAGIAYVSCSKCLSLIYIFCHFWYVALQWVIPTNRRYLHCCILVYAYSWTSYFTFSSHCLLFSLSQLPLLSSHSLILLFVLFAGKL